MKIDELISYYKTGYNFEKATSMSSTSYQNWLKWGYIPIVSQFKIEKFTAGVLKADIKHARKE